jgi:hypothetical protein
MQAELSLCWFPKPNKKKHHYLTLIFFIDQVNTLTKMLRMK